MHVQVAFETGFVEIEQTLTLSRIEIGVESPDPPDVLKGGEGQRQDEAGENRHQGKVVLFWCRQPHWVHIIQPSEDMPLDLTQQSRERRPDGPIDTGEPEEKEALCNRWSEQTLPGAKGRELLILCQHLMKPRCPAAWHAKDKHWCLDRHPPPAAEKQVIEQKPEPMKPLAEREHW